MAKQPEEIRAKVTGNGAFPTDMLRYDRCYPHSPEDAMRLYNSFTRHPDGGYDWEITVAKKNMKGLLPHNQWTPERWESFGVAIEILDL